jgi:hypothetical protein
MPAAKKVTTKKTLRSPAPRKRTAVTSIAKFDVEFVPIDSIKPYPNNPRHNENAIAKVAKSIQEFGWQQPIVIDPKGVIIAGHTRWYAAQSLESSVVPVHTARGLTQNQIRAYRIADNRVAQEATWDDTKLMEELHALVDKIDMNSLGFDPAELLQIMEAPHDFDPAKEWSDMPDYRSKDAGAFRSILVHFKSQEVLDEFIKKTGMAITPTTRYTWYPKVEVDSVKDKAYVSES